MAGNSPAADLGLEADLSVRLGQRAARLRTRDRDIVLELSDLATARDFFFRGLPRGGRRLLVHRAGWWLYTRRLRLEVQLRGRPLVVLGGASSFLARLLGWKRVRVHFGTLLLALARPA